MDILAGILLLIANIVFALGRVYYSLFLFLSANICFLLESVFHKSYFGAFTIFVGILAQVYVAWKMITGDYNKNLQKD